MILCFLGEKTYCHIAHFRYCSTCKLDTNEIVKAGGKLKVSKKTLTKTPSKSKRDWGKGMACVGRTKKCTIVPSNHFGSIPGVEVGTTWMFRVQVSFRKNTFYIKVAMVFE